MKKKQGMAIERVFEAPVNSVWKAWTEPEIIKQWWGPEGFTAPGIVTDLKVGGKYIYTMHGPAGSKWDTDIYSAGIYMEIVPRKKMVVTDYFSNAQGDRMEPIVYGMNPNFPKELTATVSFVETPAGQTLLSIVYTSPEKEEQAQAMIESGMTEGWNSSLNKLEKYLKAGSLKEDVADECEEKKLMDRVMDDSNGEFAGKERVCDKDVENVLWKLGEEPKAAAQATFTSKAPAYGDTDKDKAGELAKTGVPPGIEDVSAHSVSP